MKKLTIVYKPELLTALREDYKWCAMCQASGEVYHGHDYYMCSQCKGKGYCKKGVV